MKPLGFYSDISDVINHINEYKPDVVFNLAEAYMGEYYYDRNVPALLELLQVPYTGCSPVGLMVCNNKAVTKKILNYHKIKVPKFRVYRKGKKLVFPKHFNAPYFVKPLREEASTGITQSSFADSADDCTERILFIHKNMDKHAIVEEYIDGRELYVGVMGHKKVHVLPIWEMKFTQMPDDGPKIATYKAKWDENYRKKWGIKNELADSFPNGIAEKIRNTCKKAFKVLNIEGYVRFDLRITPNNDIYIIEANANPELADDEDFAASAKKGGLPYEKLIDNILKLAFQRK